MGGALSFRGAGYTARLFGWRHLIRHPGAGDFVNLPGKYANAQNPIDYSVLNSHHRGRKNPPLESDCHKTPAK
jgi:hypothetical protein